MSDENGLFDAPPTLDIGFTFNHKSPGLTLLFYPHSEDWASEVRVAWYSVPPEYEYRRDRNSGFIQVEVYSGVIIKSGTYTISSTVGQIVENIVNFRHIKIEFLSTNIRHRFVKMSGINYGQGRSFQDSDIDTASILEEIDPTSNEITINTLNFRIKTHNPEFSLVSGVGDDMLMSNQQMTIIGDQKEFGTFFLQFPWKDVHGNGTVIDFQAVDAIGVMDKYDFWGDVYVDVPIETLIGQLFAICFPTQLIRYVIDPVFAGLRVSGWIPKCKCRQALQYICFVIGAVADDSRRDYVWIYKPDTEISGVVDKRYMGPTIEPTTYYSGVDVISYEYALSDETMEAFKGVLPAGQKPIRFNEPINNIQISSGATILSKSANHAIINVTVPGEITITGNRYIVNQTVFSERAEVPAGEVENIKTYDNCTLMSPAYAPKRAGSLFAYLKQRTQWTGDIRLEDREVGYKYEIPTASRTYSGQVYQGLPIQGTAEQLDINMRGNRARMKVIGDVVDRSSI